jgi:hypothetical protein
MLSRLRRLAASIAFGSCIAFFGVVNVVACARTKVAPYDQKPEGGDGGVSSASTSLREPPPGFRNGWHGIEPIPNGAGTAARGAACKSSGECQSGLACLFEGPGCDVVGHCIEPGGVGPRNCAVAIPMCTCGSQRLTIFGSGGCAGRAFEPWELYACSCAVDGDCRAEQRCVPVGSMHRAGATRECRDAPRLP